MKAILCLILLVTLFVFDTYLKPNIKEDFYSSEKKYLKVILTANAGLSHQSSNLFAIIREAHHRKLILILPKFNLAAHHNNGKQLKSDLSKYYDFDKLTVNKTKFNVVKDDSAIDDSQILIIKDNSELLRKSKKFTYDRNKNYNIELPKSRDIVEMGNKISDKLGDYACVHVRRGDMLRLKENLNIETQSKNIISKLSNFDMKKVYIMTNEQNLNLFDEVKNKYDTYFFTNFRELKNIDDNYYLFFIENIIMDNAKVKISTFKTDGTYYNDYLSNHLGSQ